MPSDPIYEILAEPGHADAKRFLARWQDCTATGDLVIGKDIPSRPFARFLANIMVVEPVDNGAECHIRLAGSALLRRYGGEVSHKRFSELFSPDVSRRHIDAMRQVRETGTHLILGANEPREDAPPLRFDAIFLRALSPDRSTMWNVIGIFMYGRAFPDAELNTE